MMGWDMGAFLFFFGVYSCNLAYWCITATNWNGVWSINAEGLLLPFLGKLFIFSNIILLLVYIATPHLSYLVFLPTDFFNVLHSFILQFYEQHSSFIFIHVQYSITCSTVSSTLLSCCPLVINQEICCLPHYISKYSNSLFMKEIEWLPQIHQLNCIRTKKQNLKKSVCHLFSVTCNSQNLSLFPQFTFIFIPIFNTANKIKRQL